jgi:hypothetical protein
MSVQSPSHSNSSASDTRTSSPQRPSGSKNVGAGRPLWRRPAFWLAAAVAALAATAGGFWALGGGDSSQGPAGARARVSRGPMAISVIESGEIEAARKRIIRNEVRWTVIIEKVVADGTIVKKGDEIIRFSCKDLDDELVRQEITAANADNDYQQSVKTRVLKEEETANNVRKAEQAVDDAKDNLRRYEEGIYPNKLADATAAIQIAQRDLALAQGKADFKFKANSQPDLDSPFSPNEIEADRLSIERLKLSLQNAQNDLEMLEKYDRPREKRQYETAVIDADLAFKRAKVDRDAQMAKAIGDETARELNFRTQRDRLAQLREDVSNMVIKADTEGLVVYDTAANRWRSDVVTVAVGEKIQPRQQLMIIPDMATLQIKTRVYEAVVDQVKGRQAREQLSPEQIAMLKAMAAARSAGGNGADGGRTPRAQPSGEAVAGAEVAAAGVVAGGEGAAAGAPGEKRGGRRGGRGGSSRPASGPTTDAASMPSSGPTSGPGALRGSMAASRMGSGPAAAPLPEPYPDALTPEELVKGGYTPAFIRLDAKQGQVLKGYVEFVAPLPDAQDRWGPATNVKQFSVIVRFLKGQDVEGLRPNSNAQVTMVLAEMPNVLQAPVEAVFTEQQDTYAYRVDGTRTEKVKIKAGRANDRVVEIVEGLKEGDAVLLTAPSGQAGQEKSAQEAAKF